MTKIFSRLIFIIMIAALLVAGSMFTWPACAASSTDQGQSWLLANKGQDGVWRSTRDPAGLRSTARACLALGSQAPARTYAWLASQTARTLEESAVAALLLEAEIGASLFMPVNTHRVEEGKWGSAPDTLPDPYHTALALLSLAYSERIDSSEVTAAASYLSFMQQENGSWSAVTEGQETAAVTAIVLQALLVSRITPSSLAVIRSRQWLLGHQNQDGSWGIDGGSPAATAQVLFALRRAGCPFDVEQRAVSYLEQIREQDGSWEHDPWTTALAVSALSSEGVPDLAFTQCVMEPSSVLIPGDPLHLTASVVNQSAVPASGVMVRFRLLDTSNTVIVTMTEQIESLAAG